MPRLLAIPLVLLPLLACHDEQPRTHVYSSPPPPPPATRTQPPVAMAPELPIGTKGAAAQLISISDAANGAPVPLGDIRDSVDVLTLVALGPHSEPAQGARVELVMRGSAMDTTLVLHLPAPAPSVIAHTFRVGALKAGRYACFVRLRTSTGRVLAESSTTLLEVLAPAR